jgi:DMSO/TMAO reductase YedYZ heme-binding membrane subunit
VFAIPVIVVVTSGSFTVSPALRIAGLLAFSLLFINIVTGAFRPIFNRIFKPKPVQQWHVATGLLGFSMAVTHGSLVLFFGVAGFNLGIVLLGPSVLALLILTMVVALLRRNFAATWRWIHRINYLLFGVIFTHALILGFDFKNGAFLKVLFGIYAGVVVLGFVYRYMTLRAIKVAAAARAKAQ